MNIILTQWKNANLDNIKILNPLLGIRFKLKICFFLQLFKFYYI